MAAKSSNSSGGGKYRKSRNPARKARRARNKVLQPERKDLHVAKSSHGKFLNVASLEAHRSHIINQRSAKTQPSLDTPAPGRMKAADAE